MSYDHFALASKVKGRLQADPQAKLESVSRELALDRHTINRALVECFGVSFRTLKHQLVDERIEAVLHDGQVKSIKQSALEIGFTSAASLARRTRRTIGMTPIEVRKRPTR
jgi:AraC-like DNA-binding protein